MIWRERELRFGATGEALDLGTCGNLAVEELRMRNRDRVWFLPVVLPGGEVPDRPIGAGETLRDFNYAILYPETWSTEIRKLVKVIKKG